MGPNTMGCRVSRCSTVCSPNILTKTPNDLTKNPTVLTKTPNDLTKNPIVLTKRA